MNDKFIWWNLPAQVKAKLDIDTSWFLLLTKVNILLRELEISNTYMYGLFYEPNYKVNWFNLLSDLEKILKIYED